MLMCMEAMRVTECQTQLSTGKSCDNPAIQSHSKTWQNSKEEPLEIKMYIMVLFNANPGWLVPGCLSGSGYGQCLGTCSLPTAVTV